MVSCGNFELPVCDFLLFMKVLAFIFHTPAVLLPCLTVCSTLIGWTCISFLSHNSVACLSSFFFLLFYISTSCLLSYWPCWRQLPHDFDLLACGGWFSFNLCLHLLSPPINISCFWCLINITGFLTAWFRCTHNQTYQVKRETSTHLSVVMRFKKTSLEIMEWKVKMERKAIVLGYLLCK